MTSADRQGPRYIGPKSHQWPEGRPLCGGDKGHDADGVHEGYCRNTAGKNTVHFGTGNCDRHGGSTPTHVAKAQRELAAAAVVTYGAPIDIDPVSALFAEVHRTAGHVAWLANVVAHLEAEDLVWGVTQETEQTSGEFPGVDVVKSAKPNVWLELYRLERKHLVDVCKTVVSLQLEDRRDRAAERQAAQLVLLLEGMLADPEAALTSSQQVALRRGLVARIAGLAGPRPRVIEAHP
jgi:hypothetical protein